MQLRLQQESTAAGGKKKGKKKGKFHHLPQALKGASVLDLTLQGLVFQKLKQSWKV